MIQLTHDPIDFQSLTERVRRPSCGGVVTFLGTVRDLTGDQVTAAFQCFFRQLNRVAAFVFSLQSAEIDFQKSCAQRTHLFTRGGAHIVSFDHRAEPPRGGDGLQAGDARAQNQNARRRHSAGRSHQ